MVHNVIEEVVGPEPLAHEPSQDIRERNDDRVHLPLFDKGLQFCRFHDAHSVSPT